MRSSGQVGWSRVTGEIGLVGDGPAGQSAAQPQVPLLGPAGAQALHWWPGSHWRVPIQGAGSPQWRWGTAPAGGGNSTLHHSHAHSGDADSMCASSPSLPLQAESPATGHASPMACKTEVGQHATHAGWVTGKAEFSSSPGSHATRASLTFI